MGVSVTETTTTLAANTPTKIATGLPGCSVFILSNNGPGQLVWKTKSAPTSALDGTTLDGAATAGGQGGSVILTGADAIVDDIYAWSIAGTTVNVKQGVQRP